MGAWHGLIEQYRQYLPVTEKTAVITLNEGNNPLIKASHIDEVIQSGITLYFKYEGSNPSGSFKDRGMTLAITKALEAGSKAVICASTGNTSASASAYASKAGMSTVVLIPEGQIALGKLAQAMIHGAMVLQVDGNFDQALKIVKEIVTKHPISLVTRCVLIVTKRSHRALFPTGNLANTVRPEFSAQHAMAINTNQSRMRQMHKFQRLIPAQCVTQHRFNSSSQENMHLAGQP